MTVSIVSTSLPDTEVAETLARQLIEEHLAACVHVLPGLQSTYRWQGKLQTGTEALMMIKTSVDRLDALTARLLALHPYELPEIVAVQAEAGLPAYFDWVRAETREIPQESRPA